MAVGMLRNFQLAEDAVSQGKADLVALGRGMLYDPRWAWHAAHELGAEASYPNQYARSEPNKWPKAFEKKEVI
jgi:NADPH2 dehydrogenase